MHSKLPDGALEFVRSLRRNQTDGENLLWLLLRNRRLGVKFRRQHPVGGYILDYYCHEAGLCIELDGGQHNLPEAMAKDQRRTEELRNLGIEVVRFWDHEILKDTEAVQERIYQELLSRVSPG